MNVIEALKSFREEMGLTQTEMAELLGISYDHMSDLEDGTEQFDQSFHERFSDRVGIGLECYRWCKASDPEKLPAGVVDPSKVLTESWQRRIDSIIESANGSLFLRLKPGE